MDATQKRLLKEAKDCAKLEGDDIRIAPHNDNLYDWDVSITGPPGTPYQGTSSSASSLFHSEDFLHSFSSFLHVIHFLHFFLSFFSFSKLPLLFLPLQLGPL